jgi:hypothetical protein
MKVKKGLLIKLALVTSLLAVNVIAATPGSRCSINARILGIISVTLQGRVSSDGRVCFPLPGLPDILSPLGVGVLCGISTSIIPPAIIVTPRCPN